MAGIHLRTSIILLMIQDSGFRVQLVEVFYHDVAKMPDDSIIHSIKKSYDVLLDLLLTFFYVHLGSGSGFRVRRNAASAFLFWASRRSSDCISNSVIMLSSQLSAVSCSPFSENISAFLMTDVTRFSISLISGIAETLCIQLLIDLFLLGSGFRIQEPVRGITPRPLGEVTLLTVVVCTVSCHCEDSFVFFRHGLSEGGETLLAQA